MDDPAAYRASGHRPLGQLQPPSVAERFLADLNTDLWQGSGSVAGYMKRGPLLRREAAEVYGHQYRPLTALLYGLTPRIALAAGVPLLPTYSYFRLYQAGDVCRVHGDRPACEHSVSLMLASSDGKPWALSVGADRLPAPDASVTEDFAGASFASIAMQPGEAVLYQGVHFRHGRLEPNPNRWTAHVFLHWVEENGVYKDEAFDRPTIERAQVQRAARPAGR